MRELTKEEKERIYFQLFLSMMNYMRSHGELDCEWGYGNNMVRYLLGPRRRIRP